MSVASRFVAGPAGAIDVRDHGSGPSILLLHPHPLFGGTMGSRLIYELAGALAQAGYEATRFNYRGVGRSEGTYGHGDGECEDAQAVLATLPAPVILIGFSFGSGVALRLADHPNVSKCVLISAPCRVRDSTLDSLALAPTLRVPVHSIIGTEDELIALDDARKLAAAIPGSALTELPGADHFLTPTHIPDAVAAVLEALKG